MQFEAMIVGECITNRRGVHDLVNGKSEFLRGGGLEPDRIIRRAPPGRVISLGGTNTCNSKIWRIVAGRGGKRGHESYNRPLASAL